MAKLLWTLSCILNLSLLSCLSWLPGLVSSLSELGLHNPTVLSSFHYSEVTLRPYAWRYIRVELPPGFASLSMNIETDVNIDQDTARKLPKSKLPMICFRDDSPPLPNVSNTSSIVLSSPSNASIMDIQAHQLVEQCYLLQENIMLVLTNEQISSGVWYIGLFNGFGSASTQSKMIIRGSDFSFSANITVEGCPTSAMWGQYCNQTIVPLSCAQSDVSTNVKNHSDAGMYNQTTEKVTTCKNSFEAPCVGYKEPRGYSVDLTGMVEELKIMAANVSLNDRPNVTGNASGILYARHGAMPSGNLHDYSSDISNAPLVIQSPKVGRWYFSLLPAKQTNGLVAMEEKDISSDLCYSLDWQVQECPSGKAGVNCTWESYILQTVIRKSPSVPFESYYWPTGETISLESPNFLLEPLLSNFSLGDKPGYAWTYFLLDIPRGAAGRNLHIQLSADETLDYEIYSRFGGLPSLDTWDYYYASKTSRSNDSEFFKLYDSSKKAVSFYILYVKEGTWSFGLRHPLRTVNSDQRQTFMSIASERCPKGCSSHGTCQNMLDASGLTLYSYCSCDRDHGGFDCSVEIVSHQGHIWQSIALIGTNAAAIFPAFWTLRQKAYAEWVLFTCSGISSGLYHACDVGTWCVLSFRVLQFLDFWLSFMAVASTFVYLANIEEGSKRLMHTGIAIVTALLAVSGPTRSSNIVIVAAIGALGLTIGWLLEYSTAIRSLSLPTMLSLNILERWQSIKDGFYNFVKTLRDRFRWWFVLAGFLALFLAGLSWKLETDQTYWIWHSLWHVSIYTSSFFFLCSKVPPVDSSSTQVDRNTPYELARQTSFSRV